MITLIMLLIAAAPVQAEYSQETATEAAKRMIAYKIVTGFPDGDLHLGDPITRAQFVTLMVRAFGQGDNAALLAGTNTGFEDITASDAWATGYIAMAKALVEKNGHRLGVNAEGTQFAPKANLTSAEAVAFLMKFLGVQPDNSLSWPDSYLTPAVAKGVITAEDRAQLQVLGNAPANRGFVFYLADQAFYNYKSNGKTIYTTYADTTPPKLTVDQPASPTTESKVTITGKVEEATSLHIGTSEVSIHANGQFQHDVPLVLGANAIKVTAVDLAGNRAEQSVMVTRTEPVVVRQIDMSVSMGNGKVPVNHSANLIVTFTENGKEIEPLPFKVTVDPALGTFDARTNTFTASRTPGKGSLTVEAEKGVKRQVSVETFNGLAMISVTPNGVAVLPGEELQMEARGYDYLGNEVPLESVQWSVVMNIAKIDQTGKVVIPDISGMVVVNAFSGGQFGTAYLRVNAGEIVVEANVPHTLKPGEQVHIPMVVYQDGKVVNLPIQVDTQVGTWDPNTMTLTATKVPGRGNFIIYVAGVAQEYWIEVIAETQGGGGQGETP